MTAYDLGLYWLLVFRHVEYDWCHEGDRAGKEYHERRYRVLGGLAREARPFIVPLGNSIELKRTVMFHPHGSTGH